MVVDVLILVLVEVDVDVIPKEEVRAEIEEEDAGLPVEAPKVDEVTFDVGVGGEDAMAINEVIASIGSSSGFSCQRCKRKEKSKNKNK